MPHAVGTLVRARERDWVVLPGSDEELLLLRPIGGTEDETTGILPMLETVVPAQFDWPDPATAGDHQSARLLRDALRLGFRSSAGPFRSFGSIAVEPRPYQLVPLLMALRLDPVRLLIADDVGVGKTIEAGLVVRELLDNGTVSRFCVLCPPHLAEQWQRELSEKFHLDAELVLSGTARRLERRYCAANESIFDVLPYTIVSTDFIKSDSRRDEFIRTAPELVVIDEAHASAADPNANGRRHQRHQLLQELAVTGHGATERHLLLVTATPHSGNRGAFRSLIGLLNPAFEGLPDEERIDERTRRQLAQHFVQRRRADIRRDFAEEDHSFPARFDLPEEQGRYSLTAEYLDLMREAVAWAQETVKDESGGRQHQRIRYWSALGLLRSMASSPAAAAATLRSRATAAGAATVEEADSAGRRIVLDQDETDDEGRVDESPGADDQEILGEAVDRRSRRHLLDMAERTDTLRNPSSDAKLAHTSKLVNRLVADGYNPIVFCRFIDTADYLAEHLSSSVGKKARVISVTGRLAAEERERRITELEDEPARVLVATDCLSEGINLQSLFNSVVHYDLPWNPTRLEQREGRADRFGQPSADVRVATIYGTNNGIDEAVLNVLLRKHRQIRDELGVSIPVPGSNDEFIETVFTNLFGAQQLTFDLSGSRAAQVTTEKLFTEWDDAAEQERVARTRYAQYAIKTEGVAAEASAARAAVGQATDVARFTKAAVRMVGGTVDESRLGAVSLDLSEAAPGLKDALSAVGQTAAITAVFDLPARAGSTYLSRTHPFVEALAAFVLDGALDPDLGIERTAARCGVIRTNEVSAMTTLLLVRYRFDVTIRRRAGTDYSQLAEDVALHAFTGLPEEPDWLSDKDAEVLLTAMPVGNIGPEHRVSFIQQIADGRQELADHLASFARHSALALEKQHNRVRSESSSSGRASVSAHQPVDVLGAYVLLPG
jgi:superfamily II DNA or RNA helicase